MKRLRELLSSQEEWLVQRVLHYSGEETCIGDASSPGSSWLLGIRALSAALVNAVQNDRGVHLSSNGEDFSQDPIVSFFVTEARSRHKEGSEPGRCLAFIKCFRQAYIDFFLEHKRKSDFEVFRRLVEAYFDRLEVGFFTQWDKMAQGQLVSIDELLSRPCRSRPVAEVVVSETPYRELFENMRSGVAICKSVDDGADFILKDFNPAAERNEGCSREKLIGRSVTELFPGIRQVGLYDVFQRVSSTGIPESFPTAFYRDERIAGWRDHYVYRLPSGEVAAIYDDMTADIEAQMAISAEKERLDATLRSISDGVIATDANGIIVLFNKAAEALTGLAAKEANGKPLSEVLPVVDSQAGESCGSWVQGILKGSGKSEINRHCIYNARNLGEIRLTLAVAPILDSEGKTCGTVMTFRELVERPLAAVALAGAPDSYLKGLDESPTLIWRSGHDGRCDYFNNTWLKYTGRQLGQEFGDGWMENIHPEDVSRCKQVHEAAYRKHQYFEIELQLRRYDGEYRWILCSGRPFDELDGSFGGFVFSGYDIAERRMVEDSLRRDQERFRDLYEQAPLGCHSLDAEGRIVAVNKSWLDLFGYVREEVIGRKFSEFLSPNSRADFAKGCQQLKAFGELSGIELGMLCKNQSRVCVAAFGSVGRDDQGRFELGNYILQNITEHRRAKEALRESEERFRSAFHHAAIGMALVSPDGRFLQVNRSLCDMLGYAEQEMLDLPWQVIADAEERYGGPEHFRRLLDGEVQVEQAEQRYLHKNGQKVWVQVSSSLLCDADGRPLYFVSQFRDVNQRKQAERDRVLLAAAAEQSVESIVMIDCDGIISYANLAFEKIHNCRREDAMGQHFRVFLGDDSAEPLYLALWESLSRGETWHGHISEKDRQGQPRELTTSISPIRDEVGKVIHYVVTQRDVTQERVMERQLRQAKKMEAIGTLAGGIAHDFNNILAAIIGYSEMVLFKIEKGSPIRHNLEQVLRASNRAKELVKQILAFSRQNEQELKPVQVGIIIKEALKLLRASLPTTIEIRQQLAVRNALILADPVQIHQVVMNLCANAAHAMRASGGVLEVKLAEEELDGQAVARHADLGPGHYLCLTIKDSGHGMSPEIMARIFDPFFSTKIPGEGTGMGLSVVHGIVKTHGGTIEVTSELGTGTTFQVYLPRLQSDTEPKPRLRPHIARGNERVLFVDDEEAVVDMGRQVLTHLGYEVVALTSSENAIELFRQDPSQFDLVITDQTMPRITGIELAREILRTCPEMPVILCTGFSDIVTAEEAKLEGIREYVLKPIVTVDLANTIRNILDTQVQESQAL
jgi:PAS domain S-box-containing protein